MQPMLAYLTQCLIDCVLKCTDVFKTLHLRPFKPVSQLPAGNFGSYERDKDYEKFYTDKSVKKKEGINSFFSNYCGYDRTQDLF